MKIQTLVLVAATCAAVGAIAPRAGAQSAAEPASGAAAMAGLVGVGDADGAFVSTGKFSEPDGEKVYRRVCAGCHMPDARGSQGAGMYPALARNERLVSNTYPVYVVLKGLNGMPGVGRMMSDQQVADVVNYVRTHFGNRYRDKVTAGDVQAIR